MCFFFFSLLRIDPTFSDVASDEIPMPHVSPAILGVVCDYLVYHTETPPTPIPQPLPSNELSDFLDEFDAKLVDRKETEVFELLLVRQHTDSFSFPDEQAYSFQMLPMLRSLPWQGFLERLRCMHVLLTPFSAHSSFYSMHFLLISTRRPTTLTFPRSSHYVWPKSRAG